MNKTIISVVGPTAIGKTRLAIALAQHFNTEIISADSRQFFKEMSIGTAVPEVGELAAAPHHFIQHISIHDAYTVGDFERDALKLAKSLFKTHDVVVLVGGSGLYVNAFTQGLDVFPDIAPEIRQQLNRQFEETGLGGLQTQLKVLDPTYATTVDLKNPHRLIRALEVCLGTGKPYSAFLNQKKPVRPFDLISIGLASARETIYGRIDQRVDLMMEKGLFHEAKALYPYRHLNALQTVGYKELFEHISGTTDLNSAVSEIKKNTRRFAKRQLTWFRKNKKTIWFPYDMEQKAIIKEINVPINK